MLAYSSIAENTPVLRVLQLAFGGSWTVFFVAVLSPIRGGGGWAPPTGAQFIVRCLWNPGLVWVGRGPKPHLVPPVPWQGPLPPPQGAPKPSVQPGLVGGECGAALVLGRRRPRCLRGLSALPAPGSGG